MSASREDTSGPTTSSRFRATRERRGFLADLAHSHNVELFSMALNEFAKGVGVGENKRVLLVVDHRPGGTLLVGSSKFRKGYI